MNRPSAKTSRGTRRGLLARRRVLLTLAAMAVVLVSILGWEAAVSGRSATARSAGPAARIASRAANPTEATAAPVAGDPIASTPATGSAAASLPASDAALTPRPTGPRISGPATLPVPILMYHIIAPAPPGARYGGLYVEPADFMAQLGYLTDNGYEAVTLKQVYDFWRGSGRLPAHPVVLSFDDGNPSDFTTVAPLLARLHWPGVLNIVAGRGRHARMPTAQVRAMVAAGWEVDSHTISHVDLRTLSSSRLAFELGGSRDRLRALYGVPVDFFCYPAGRYDARVVAAVKAAGYLGATTTHPGEARPDELFTMKRIRVAGGETLSRFAARIKQGHS